MKKLRHGRYYEYEKRILEFLIQQKEDVTATTEYLFQQLIKKGQTARLCLYKFPKLG